MNQEVKVMCIVTDECYDRFNLYILLPEDVVISDFKKSIEKLRNDWCKEVEKNGDYDENWDVYLEHKLKERGYKVLRNIETMFVW
jgi:hypothetical protein